MVIKNSEPAKKADNMKTKNSNLKKIEIFSFGFKYYSDNLPECDLRIDLRNKMHNPQSHLPKGAIGKDKIVIKTILDSEQNKKYIKNLLKRIYRRILETDLETYRIGIGCRSGIHRSVVVADYLNENLIQQGYKTYIEHINLKI